MRIWLYLLSVGLVMASVIVMPEGVMAPLAAVFAYIAGWLAARVDG